MPDKDTYYAMTLDPVHVGTGGSRLGRVDNAIVREPGTNLPKIPGTSISGVCRANSAMAIQSADVNKPRFLRKKTNPIGDVYESCAGKGADDGNGHCGKPGCEICVSFGFSQKSGSSFQGLAQFFDARILFFPAYSMIGPVWVTCPSILKELGCECKVGEKKFKAIDKEYKTPLNFGWLMLENDSENDGKIALPMVKDKDDKEVPCKGLKDVPTQILDKAFVVPDALFSRIVNDNLEVRTSVAIDPATGAAEDGALYTYEAIPRATVLWFDVVYSDPAYFRIKKDKVDKEITVTPNEIKQTVDAGLSLMEQLGIGGMNTRGMGRLRILYAEEVKS